MITKEIRGGNRHFIQWRTVNRINTGVFEMVHENTLHYQIGVGGRLVMKEFRTAVSVIIMIIAGTVGFFVGAAMNEPLNGAILLSGISGIACIVYAIDNKEN